MLTLGAFFPPLHFHFHYSLFISSQCVLGTYPQSDTCGLNHLKIRL